MKTQSPALLLSLPMAWRLSPARLLVDLLAGLLCVRRAVLPARRRPIAATTRPTRTSHAEVEAEIHEPGGCGWFDSSHELLRGLQVQELTPPQSQAAALPLAIWLQLQVR